MSDDTELAREEAEGVCARVEAGEMSPEKAYWQMQAIKFVLFSRTDGAAVDDATAAALNAFNSVAFKSPPPTPKPNAPPGNAKRARCRHPRANLRPHA